jgi:hypothetical protein
MSILLADSFDFYNTGTDMTYVGSPWVSTAAGVNGSLTPYGAGQSAAMGNSTFTSVPLSNEATIYASFNIMTTTTFTGGSTSGFMLTLFDGTTAQVSLLWAYDGNLYAYTNGGLFTGIGSVISNLGPHGMAPNSWCHWQVKAVINNVTGSLELRKNNNTVNDFTLTGINTRNGTANNYANKIMMTCGAAFLWYMDDVFCNSGSGAAPNTWPGQLRGVQLMPSADTAQKDLTPSTGTVNSACVDEPHMNSDTDFVSGATAGQTDLYDLQDLGLTPTAIPLVVVRHALKKSDTGTRTATTRIKSGAAASDQSAVTLATTYQWQNTYLALDPNTTAAWTYSGVNALQCGPKVVS